MTVTGEDGLARPAWAASDPLMQEYYDTEWGMPVRDEHGMFERISLEAFQSGLSWATILRKRPAFRAAFDGFDPDAVSAYDERDVERLMADAGIVRNRRKVEATITNARATVALREDGGLVDLVWSFRPADDAGPDVVRRGADALRGVAGAVQGAARARLHVRRADDDVRPHGGGRHRRHPPRRQPPPRVVGGVDLMLTPSQSALVSETLRVALHAAAEVVDGSMDAAPASGAPHEALPEVGANVTRDLVVAAEDTAAAMGHPDDSVQVLGSPRLALWFELVELRPAAVTVGRPQSRRRRHLGPPPRPGRHRRDGDGAKAPAHRPPVGGWCSPARQWWGTASWGSACTTEPCSCRASPRPPARSRRSAGAWRAPRRG